MYASRAGPNVVPRAGLNPPLGAGSNDTVCREENAIIKIGLLLITTCRQFKTMSPRSIF